MNEFDKLSDFKKIYGLSKVNTIYVDTNKNTLLNMINSLNELNDDYSNAQEVLNNVLAQLKNASHNILLDDEYSKEEDGLLKVDYDKIYEKYKNFYVVGLYPQLGKESEKVLLASNGSPSYEDIIKSADSYILVLKKILPRNRLPKVVSNIDGYCVLRYSFFEDPAYTEEGDLLSGATALEAVFDNIEEAYKFIKKKKDQYSVLIQIKKGRVMRNSIKYYYTNEKSELEDMFE